jgi:hypothetical protein
MTKNSVKIKWLQELSWKAKLPMIVGSGFIVFSLPVIFGVVVPSMHGDNSYSMLYFIINLPAIFIFKLTGVADVMIYLFGSPPTHRYLSDLLFTILFFLFYLSISYLVGVIVDMCKKKSKL